MTIKISLMTIEPESSILFPTLSRVLNQITCTSSLSSILALPRDLRVNIPPMMMVLMKMSSSRLLPRPRTSLVKFGLVIQCSLTSLTPRPSPGGRLNLPNSKIPFLSMDSGRT